jgi:hypothetical protein
VAGAAAAASAMADYVPSPCARPLPSGSVGRPPISPIESAISVEKSVGPGAPPLPSSLLFYSSHGRCMLLCLQHSRGAWPRLLIEDAHGSALHFATFKCFLTRAAGASVKILVDACVGNNIGALHSRKLLLNCGILTGCPSLPLSPHLAVDYLSQRLSQ